MSPLLPVIQSRVIQSQPQPPSPHPSISTPTPTAKEIAVRQIEVLSKVKGVSEPSSNQGVATLNSSHIQEVMNAAETVFPAAQTSVSLHHLPVPQPVTSFMPVQATEEEKKKAAAAVMAAKLTASTSFAQMLTSVLSSLFAEEAASMNGAQLLTSVT